MIICHHSPQYIFILLFNLIFGQSELEEFGIDWDGPVPEDSSEDFPVVEVPDTDCPLSQGEYQRLCQSINPLGESDCYGIDIFSQTVSFVTA